MPAARPLSRIPMKIRIARLAAAVTALAFAAPAPAAPHRFAFRPPAAAVTSATKVALTGELLGWDPAGLPMARQSDGTYAVEMEVPDGRYLYKFTMDAGDKGWFADDANPDRESDGNGGFNSVLTVGDAKSARRAGASGAAGNAPATARATNRTQPSTPWAPEALVLKGDSTRPATPVKGWVPVTFRDGELATSAGSRLLISDDRLTLPGGEDAVTSPTCVPRRVFAWLPPGYGGPATGTPGARRYPVVYLHDGQNVYDDPACCFGNGGWELDKLMDPLGPDGAPGLPQAILIGIPNNPPVRRAEYGVGDDVFADRDTPYVRFLVEVVKPRIDRDFATKPGKEHTVVMGSSMGGVISIVAAWRHPEVFGTAVAISTAFLFADSTGRTLTDKLRRAGEPGGPGAPKFRLYLDSGDSGLARDGAPATREFAALARRMNWGGGKPDRFLHLEFAGESHNEKAWRRRARRPLEFALGGR